MSDNINVENVENIEDVVVQPVQENEVASVSSGETKPVADEKDIVLKVRNLSQHFGRNKAVDNVSFDVVRGEVLGLVGESGCGKTTIGRTIIKLYDATDGEVFLDGKRIIVGVKKRREEKLQAITQRKEARRVVLGNLTSLFKGKEERAKLRDAYKNYRSVVKTTKSKCRDNKNKALEIQMIFQDPTASLDPRMVVRDIITEGLVINGERDREVIDKKLYDILERIGLVREHASRYQHEFSGGQRQRIGIARSVIMNPKILIADEPISALDVSIQAQVITLLNEIKKAFNLTIIFIAHDISVVKYFSDRIAVMYYGQIKEIATTEQLFKNPLHPYTRALLSAVPYPDPVFEKQRKRIVYNPIADHDYSVEKPTMREIAPGHSIYCNSEEFERYKKEYKY